MAPTIDYNGYVSVSNILNRPDFMDADDLRQKWNEGYTFNGANLKDFGANTDWLGELTRTAVSHSHNLSLRVVVKIPIIQPPSTIPTGKVLL